MMPESLESAVLEALELEGDAQRERIADLRAKYPQHDASIVAMCDAAASSGVRYGRTAGALIPEPQAPRRVGIYHLLKVIGEGGMGQVWLAEQRAPVERRVALKLIKSGLGSKQILVRFEAERQALALMNHEAIARILDAGTSEHGEPYFVMEYVDGLPLLEFCDRERLGIRERIELFCEVCAGVQHAHQKGIIHRDLKPANILVVRDGDSVRPKIIDFGLARALERKLVHSTLVTQAGQLLGTPEYMSPEQAAADDSRIDTRTDIYSLGVILHELLTGLLPFDRKELRSRDLFHMQKVIVNAEWAAPSTRLQSASDDVESVARCRGMDRSALVRRVRGELDWIILKALSKDSVHRYSSAAEFARDLRSHLLDEPILAAKPTSWYRLRKFGRRYRAALLAVAGVVLALLTGLLMSQRNTAFARAQEREAARQAERAQRLYEDLQRERIPELLRALVAEERRLWPARPEMLPLLKAWLERADALRDGGEQIQDTLDKLRTERGQVIDARARGFASDIPLLRDRIERDASKLAELSRSTNPRSLRHVERLQLALDQSYRQLEKRQEFAIHDKIWRFASLADAVRHREWTRLRIAFDTFDRPGVGTRARIQSRIQLAERVGRCFLEDAEAWREVRRRLADKPDFAGVEVPAVAGLTPLGPDPRSGLEEFASIEVGALPMRIGDEMQVRDATGIVFVLLPGGPFAPGATTERGHARYDPDASPDEQPIRPVELAPFYISKYELTQAQWLRLTGDKPSFYSEAEGQRAELCRPLENIAASDVERVLWRMGMSLPTEAQWEYACRAGSDSPWSGARSLEELGRCANVVLKRLPELAVTPWQLRVTREAEGMYPRVVGSFAPNAWGLYDMHGNVAEWTRDVYSDYRGGRRAGDGAAQGDFDDSALSERARRELRQYSSVRGGAFSMLAKYARSASRIQYSRDLPSGIIGVRPVLPLAR